MGLLWGSLGWLWPSSWLSGLGGLGCPLIFCLLGMMWVRGFFGWPLRGVGMLRGRFGLFLVSSLRMFGLLSGLLGMLGLILGL
jgi:hypothetical protein